MKTPEYLIAKPVNNGMEIYVSLGGVAYFLMSHRWNSRLFAYLRDGKSLSEIRSFKPGRNQGMQKLHRSLAYMLRVIDSLSYECAA